MYKLRYLLKLTFIVLFEFYDLNDDNFLEEGEIQFLAHTCIQAAFKIFSIGGVGTATMDSNV